MQRSSPSPNLDLLRAVAVLAVLVDHAGATLGYAERYGDLLLWPLGRWGVLLFFVHTSLVLMMSLERLGLTGWRLYATFYVRRIFRIYPLSVAAVALALFAHIPTTSWAGAYERPGFVAIVSNFLLCQNLTATPSILSPLWSLPYEVQMYLFLPALFVVIRRYPSWITMAALWLAAVAIGLLQARLSLVRGLGVGRLGIAEFAPCFLAGLIAYRILREKPKARLPFVTWPLTLGIVTAAYLLWRAHVGMEGYVEWLCCLPIGLLVAFCAESNLTWLNTLTHYVAKYSYGVYLAQVPVLWFVFVKLHYLPTLAKALLFLILIVFVPVASYHLLEGPLMHLGAELTKGWLGKRDPVKAIA